MLINDYEIIVIGGNHHNTLGVIRCLGEKKIKSNLIVINENRYAYITKSKYVKNFDIVNYDEETIKKILLKKYSKFKNKAILIPTSDFAALFIDKNLNELKKYFTVSSINNKQNEIEKMMDKYNQYLLARKNNIKISKSLIFDLNEKISDEIPVPCILKPISSVLGNKDDIEICNTKDELKEKIEILKNKKYLKILIQELVDYDYECDIVGCSNKSKLIVPGAVRKIRRYPIKGGSNSFSKILSLDSFKFNIDKILNLIKNMKYQGLFDIEIFVKGDDIYLNEINFRNSANSYAYMYGNVNIIYLSILLLTDNSIDSIPIKVKEDYYFQDEVRELKNLLCHNITLKEYIKTLKISKSFLVLNKKDLKPVFFKFIYAILRRIDNK